MSSENSILADTERELYIAPYELPIYKRIYKQHRLWILCVGLPLLFLLGATILAHRTVGVGDFYRNLAAHSINSEELIFYPFALLTLIVAIASLAHRVKITRREYVVLKILREGNKYFNPNENIFIIFLINK